MDKNLAVPTIGMLYPSQDFPTYSRAIAYCKNKVFWTQIARVNYECILHFVKICTWTSYLKLENSMSLTSLISNSIRLMLDDLCLRKTRTQWYLKYSKYSGQHLKNSSPNSSLNSKKGRNLNSQCVLTRSFEAWWNSNTMKSEFVQALVNKTQNVPFTNFWSFIAFILVWKWKSWFGYFLKN